MSRVAVAVALSLAATVLVACGNDREEVFSLEVGDCFDDPDGSVDEVYEVPIVGCEEPHDNEVYAIHELANGDFPGDAEVAESAQMGCIERFAGYVGTPYAESELFATWLFPTEMSWGAGDREVICVLFAEDGPLEGSMQDSGR